MKDLWYWQIELVADQIDSVYKKVQESHSSIFVPLRKHKGEGYSKYFIVQDPDGHALFIKD